MTKADLLAQIASLTTAAESLTDDVDKTIALNDIDTLKNHVDGMALDDVANIMSAMTLPDIAAMKAKIAAANDALKGNGFRLNLITGVLGQLTSLLLP